MPMWTVEVGDSVRADSPQEAAEAMMARLRDPAKAWILGVIPRDDEDKRTRWQSVGPVDPSRLAAQDDTRGEADR